MKILLTLILASYSLLAQAQKVYDQPMLTYVNDLPVRSFVTENLELFIAPEVSKKIHGFGKELRLNVFVKNKGDVPFNVGPDMIDVYVVKNNGKQTSLEVYSTKEYISMVKKNILLWGPDDTQKVNATATMKDGKGQKTGEVTASTYVYTGAREEAYSSAEEFVDANYLKRNTLPGGGEINGFVAVKSPKGKPFEVKVELGGDVFMFKFDDYDE